MKLKLVKRMASPSKRHYWYSLQPWLVMLHSCNFWIYIRLWKSKKEPAEGEMDAG